MSKTFKIPVVWQSWGLVEVEANTLEEAIELAKGDNIPLPTNAEYVEGSFEIDGEDEEGHIESFNR